MLRSPSSRVRASYPFICWACSAKLQSRSFSRTRTFTQGTTLLPAKNRKSRRQSLCKTDASSAATTTTRYLSTDTFVTPHNNLPPPEKPPAIRQILQKWELENAPSIVPDKGVLGTWVDGDLLNAATRSSDVDGRIQLGEHESAEEDALISIGRDGLLEVGNRRGFLLAGDLVELKGVMGQLPELAIFVRELDRQSQFYTMTGKWIHRSSQSAHFFVPNFVDPAELDAILPFLPTEDISNTLRDKLQDFPPDVPRDLGRPLVLKMLEFWAMSDQAYQAASTCLDKAHDEASYFHSMRYATLQELSELVLPDTTPRNEHGKFPDHFSYAVHRSLLRDGVAFRPQTQGTLRNGGEYEVTRRRDIGLADSVCAMVRIHREHRAAIASGAEMPKRNFVFMSALGAFVEKMQHLIDYSRQFRAFTTHGTLKLIKNDQESYDAGMSAFPALRISNENNNSGKFIRFLEMWAADSFFGSHSHFNGIGAEILRATERYPEADLTPTTAWTFLQEIGHLSHWANRVPYDLRLLDFDTEQLHKHDVSCDTLKQLRKDWEDLPVYCIDEPGAHEIDDGISLEATDVADEYFVHIHTANPSSRIRPESGIAKRAEKLTENVYLPEKVFSMLDTEIVKEAFSLASNRPSLTFSARVDKQGNILETSVTPGTLRNVLYLSMAVVEEVVLGSTNTKLDETILSVGSVTSGNSPSRRMLKAHELSDKHKADLHILHEIGGAHAALLRAKGGIDQNFAARAKSSVSMPDSAHAKQGDPTIQITMAGDSTGSDALPRDQSNLVQSCMLIASQIAGRWCKERGIPVPYRVTPKNPAKEDPAEFFHRKILPSRAENGVATMDITSEYIRLIGGAVPSATPGPHAAVGVDMMARCTSPLRRYTDMLVHWQVGAALLEERRLGHSLVGNTKDDFLPFSRDRVESFLPRFETRERLIRHGHREAERHWLCLYLLRAWQFKEAEIPTKFSFQVVEVDVEKRMAYGMLMEFTARAHCSIPEEVDIEGIAEGDKLEVELEEVNVYLRKIQVKALRKMEAQESVGHDVRY